MDKKDMILALIEHYSNGSKARFANLLGISPQGLSTWIKRKSFDIELVFSKCENLSAQWLLTGEGNMLNDLPDDTLTELVKTDPTKGENYIPPTAPIETMKACRTENANDGIPLIPFSAMAGALTGELKALEYECERYIVPAFKGADFLMPVKGNSMVPTYASGDIVACQRVPMTDIFFQWNKPYVLDTAQGALIKRLKPGSDNQHVLIVSDNKEYDPFELSYQEINAVAMVIGLIRLE